MTSATRSLWPDDLKTGDMRTPTEIMREQADLLARQTNGLLNGNLVEHTVQDRNVIGFDIDAPRIPTTVRLFEVHQSPKFVYPARIIPPTVEVPDYLRKRVYHPPVTGVSSLFVGGWEERQWVADSATEFTEKLEELLSSSEIKAILLNLLTRSHLQHIPPVSDPAA